MKTPHLKALRMRLIATYASVLMLALAVFAAGALFAIDRTLRTSLDERLRTQAVAAGAVIDTSTGHVIVDPDDRASFLKLMASSDGLVLDDRNRLRLSSVAHPPRAFFSLQSAPAQLMTVGRGDDQARAFMLPLMHTGRRVGTVVVWRPSDWVDEIDRDVVAAFAAAVLLLAGLAAVAGSAVTQRALADAFERQRRFTADASHELRTPLAVIRAEADLALRRDRTPDAYRAALGSIVAESDRMESLIGDLLSAARAESGMLESHPIDVAVVVRDVAARLGPLAEAKGASVDVEGAESATVLGQREAVERAVLAVAHNAVKHARGRVHLRVRKRTKAIDVLVEDDGPGFTPDALQHAGERFWRGKGGGAGLGLAIAAAIVEQMGGTIDVANATTGARVALSFPSRVQGGVIFEP